MLLIFLGIMTGQLLYMCTLWLQHKKKEYGYYVVHYILFVYFLFGLSAPFIFTPEYISSYQRWFNLLQLHPLHIFNYYLYIRFAQHYLETRKLFPPKNRQAENMMRAVWVCTGISFLCWTLMDIQTVLYQQVYLAISIFLMLWALYLIYLIYTMRTRQSQYLFRGSLLLSAGVLASYVLIGLEGQGAIPAGPELLYPAIFGVLGEIYYVNAGLNYKASIKRKQLIRTQQQWIEELKRNEKLLLEKETVRNDLSLHLNKEIGVTLNGINLFAQHSLLQIENRQWHQVKEILERIVADSNGMVNNMNEIVWLLSADNDTLARSLARIRSYATRLCREKDLQIRITGTDERDVLAKLDMIPRRTLYQGFKTYFELFLKRIDEKVELETEVRADILYITFRGRMKDSNDVDGQHVFPLNDGFRNVLTTSTGSGEYEWKMECDISQSLKEFRGESLELRV